MIGISHDLQVEIQQLKQALETIKRRLILLKAHNEREEHQYEAIERRLAWLDDNDKEQQMQIENIMRRISNDFPVTPWDDD